MKVKDPHLWSPESTPTFWINHASRLVMRCFEQRLRPLDLGAAYIPVVMALEKNGALQQKDLAKLAHVEQATMAILLARMERDALIAREPHPRDKRASLISLSTKARARLPSAREGLAEVVEQAISGFSERECEMLIALLRRVVKNLDDAGHSVTEKSTRTPSRPRDVASRAPRRA